MMVVVLPWRSVKEADLNYKMVMMVLPWRSDKEANLNYKMMMVQLSWRLDKEADLNYKMMCQLQDGGIEGPPKIKEQWWKKPGNQQHYSRLREQ